MHTDIDMEDIKLEDKTKIIAVAGKGGVGKTSLAGVIVKLLVESFPDKKILAIDADPAVGLSTVLNVDVDKTIDDIRKEVIKNVEDGDTKSAVELLGEAKYEIYDALKEQDGYCIHFEYDGKVQVVNNQRISVTQQQSVLDAMNLREEGKSAAEIKEILEKEKLQASIYITVDTLKYLKKGGRITPAAAAIGTVLNLKPVLQIQGEKLDAFEKARGVKQAKKAMIKAMKKDMDKRFAKERAAGIMGLHIAYTANDKEVIDGWIAEVKEAFPDFEVDAHPLSLSVGCHIGPCALGIACEKKSAIS